jgi:hypothetical protein
VNTVLASAHAPIRSISLTDQVELQHWMASIGDVIELRLEETSDAGDFVGVKLTITAGAQDPIEQTVTANAGLTYDAATDTYTYVWKTQKAWAGRCGTFHLGLKDGSDHQALFHFTK